jgi:hypothetical protein
MRYIERMREVYFRVHTERFKLVKASRHHSHLLAFKCFKLIYLYRQHRKRLRSGD